MSNQVASFFLILLFHFKIISRCIQCQPLSAATASTSKGPITGRIVTENGRSFSVFQGIPYAKPPIAQLRFKQPQDISSWVTSKNASAFTKPCPIPNSLLPTDEDCLYLNVFSPHVLNEDTVKYPVLFWIGHAFNLPLRGSLRNLVSREIVLITLNYRQGALGFWSTLSNVAPGNTGLSDIIAALKWTRNEIGYFGGDAQKVTIAGEGEGAELASLLTLSPVAKGLFQQAILISGSGLARRASNVDNPFYNPNRELATKVGCIDSVPSALPIDIPAVRNPAVAEVSDKSSGDRNAFGELVKLNNPGALLHMYEEAKTAVGGWMTKVGLQPSGQNNPMAEVFQSFDKVVTDTLGNNKNAATFLNTINQISSNPQRPLAGMFNFALGGNLPADQNMLECMQNIPLNQILRAQEQISSSNPPDFKAWSPRMDGYILPRPLTELINERPPISMMIGTSDDEAAYDFFMKAGSNGNKAGINDLPINADKVTEVIQQSISMLKMRNPAQVLAALQYQYVDRAKLLQAARSQFTSNDRQMEEAYWFSQAVSALSSYFYWVPSYQDAWTANNRGSDVFLFSFDYVSTAKQFPIAWTGSMHNSILEYLFDMDFESDSQRQRWAMLAHNQTVTDKDMRAFLGTLVTNFVKFSNPTITEVRNIKWDKLEEDKANYLSMDMPTPQMLAGYHAEDVLFWTKLVEKLEGM